MLTLKAHDEKLLITTNQNEELSKNSLLRNTNKSNDRVFIFITKADL